MNRNSAIKELLPVIIVTIVGTYFFSYISYVLMHTSYPESFLEMWTKWDTRHYLKIAEYGYSENSHQIAFFPLYPYLIRIFTVIFQNYMLSALIISNAAYAIAVYFLYKIVKLDFENEDAYRAVIYLSVFPTAYFLHAGYSESLFLALAIGSMYFGRKKSWALAGVLGMLAASTRLIGIILLPVLVIEYLSQKEFKLKEIRADILLLLIIGIGFIAYLALNYSVSGDPFYFLKVQQEGWSKKLAFPHVGFINALGGGPASKATGALGGDWAEIIFAGLGLAATVYSFFKLRLSYSVYLLLTYIVFISNAYWGSIPRFLLTAFPIFIVLSMLGRCRSINFIIIFLSLLGFALYLTQFLRFRWAF